MNPEINRRHLLKGAAGLLAVPALAGLASTAAMATSAGARLMKQRIFFLLAATAILVCSSADTASAAGTARAFDERDRQEVRAVFLQQAAAATDHDLVAFDKVFVSTPAGQPDPVAFVARAYQFWGKAALMKHFEDTFKGAWKFEPDAEKIRIVALTPDTAEIYAPTQVTFGKADEPAKTAPFLVYEIAVRTADGWRIAAIVPVPAR